MAFNFVQLQDLALAGGGITSTDTSITVTSLAYVDGTLVAMADFGALGFGTLEPETSREENFSFTGVTQNGDGSATFTGCTRGLQFKTPYTQDLTLRQSHGGAALLRITNSAPFYDQLINNDNDETITGVYTFVDPSVPRMDTAHTYIAGQEEYLATKRYVDGVALSGAPDASTTQKGIVQEATQAQSEAKTATGSTGARLFVNPSTMNAVRMHDYAASSSGTDTYAITLTPAPTAYTTGDVFIFKADVANTGAATLNVNSLGAKTILHGDGSALTDSDISANAIGIVAYDGTNMKLLGGVSSAASSFGVQNSSYVYAASTSGNDTYTITVSPTPLAYAVGQMFLVKPDTANTGAATLNVNTLGAKTIKKSQNVDLETGDILANQVFHVVYDGTNFLLLSLPAALTQGITTPIVTNHAHKQTHLRTTYDVATVSGTVNYAHGLGAIPNWVRASAFVNNGAGITASFGHYDRVNNTNAFAGFSILNATGDTTNIINLSVSSGSVGGVVTSVDATNVTITYTKASSPTGTASLLLEFGV